MARTETRMIEWAMEPPLLAAAVPANAAEAVRYRTREFVKRLIDIVVALVLLIAALPILLAAMAAIRLTSRGPAIFRQWRAGIGGRPFVMYKLRTMYRGAEQDRETVLPLNEHAYGPCFKSRCDPRVTFVGRILRKTSIDELPQLINVIRGEMSLVGPRPLPLNEVSTATHAERMRLTVRPGLTCLWQISGRTEIPYEEWVLLDLHYIRNRSLGLDLRILLQTVPAVLSGRGAY